MKCPHCGREIVRVKRTSDPQRKYWFAVPMMILGEYFGMDKDECHDAVMLKFTHYTDEHGLERRRSINDLDESEMSKLIEDVIRWAVTEYGVQIPYPNEVPVAEYELN